ncbi:unnamed protein product [Ilex paraguariensis]|uniref:Uncharacterized protein n=1 Tax=Ilex paraguariensis TaxID=185542 RepID=A0ABC8TJL8_9AQUA
MDITRTAAIDKETSRRKRSSKSFRRQGSSGSIWDEKLNSEEIKKLMQNEGKVDQRELRHCQSIGGVGTINYGISNAAVPSVYWRSFSTPAMMMLKKKKKPYEESGECGGHVVGASEKPPNPLRWIFGKKGK